MPYIEAVQTNQTSIAMTLAFTEPHLYGGEHFQAHSLRGRSKWRHEFALAKLREANSPIANAIKSGKPLLVASVS
jgi:hypothetical protein